MYGQKKGKARRALRRLLRPEVQRILNWGGSGEEVPNYNVINTREAVRSASHKKRAFEVLSFHEVQHVPFTFNKEEAEAWLAEGSTVYARHLTRANSGRGITVVQPGSPLPYAPLYTRGIPCKREYRVHVFEGRVIDTVSKCKRNGDEETGDYIRNHAVGYIFTRNSVKIPDGVRATLSSLAIDAVSALGLHFGAVDIIRGMDNECYVLEINTAPGLVGLTLTAYVEALNSVNTGDLCRRDG
jgi:hypothetical protein